MQNKIPTGLVFMYYTCCYLQNYLAWPAATPNKLAEPPLISRSSMFLSLCRAATTRDTRWWWTLWSTTFTSSPVGSSTPRPLPSSVCYGDTHATHLHTILQRLPLWSVLTILVTNWLWILLTLSPPFWRLWLWSVPDCALHCIHSSAVHWLANGVSLFSGLRSSSH